MNTHISFNVYGTSLGVLEQEAIAELARFSNTDFQWTINLEVTAQTTSADGATRHWKAEVSAYPKHTTGHWQDGS